MDLAFALTILASVLFLGAPTLYLLGVYRNQIDPNPASWLIWAVVGSINSWFYYQNAPPDEKFLAWFSLFSAIVLVFVFLYTLKRKAFGSIGETEVVTIGLTMAVMGTWWYMRDQDGAESLASALMQIPMFVGFIPTYNGLIRGTARESPWPWLFGAAAYVLQIAALAISPDQDWTRYAWPVVNGLFGNGGVTLLSVVLKPKPTTS